MHVVCCFKAVLGRNESDMLLERKAHCRVECI